LVISLPLFILKQLVALVQQIEQLHQSADQFVQEAVGVKYPDKRAKQIAEQITSARNGRDIQVNRCEINHETQQIQMDRTNIIS
jgi:hypothetical protein